MRNFLMKVVINAIALVVTAYLLPGITLSTTSTVPVLVIALIFGIVNAIVKPLVIIITLPFTIVTLGLFLFVVNGLMLLLTSALSGGRLVVDGLIAAVLGGIVMGIVGMIVESVFKQLGLVDDRRRRRDQ
jgi:putative membrane protein